MLKSLRPWATPLTVGTTLVTAVTGVLLFFHLSPALVRPSHEWIGMLMIVGIVAHLVLNWRALKTYFKRPIGLGIIALGVVATVGSLLIPPAEDGAAGNPFGLIMQTMSGAEIETLADLAHRPVDDVIADLSVVGADAKADSTLMSLTDGNRDRLMELVQVILTP